MRGEVVASTFDEPASRHVQVAEMVIEKAKRLVEHKKDVVILLDSITRLARAYNTVVPASGKVLTGGVDANALQQPEALLRRRAQRRGRRLAHHHRHRADRHRQPHGRRDLRGIQGHRQHGDPPRPPHGTRSASIPAINVNRSGTRREELLIPKELLQKIWVLRKLLYPMDELEATEFLLDKLKATKNNAEFFDSMRRGARLTLH